MQFCDAGWCWEGQGLDPGVHPSVLGVGDGARYFGIRRVRFLFHPTTELALERLHDMEEVVVDVTKWLLRDAGKGGSESYVEPDIETVCREAERVSRLSRRSPNITGAIHDDMLGLIRRAGIRRRDYGKVVEALRRHNPELKLWCVVYTHELDADHWRDFLEYMDALSLWVWTGYGDLDRDIAKCRRVFGDKPTVIGVYLRDYQRRIPQPIEILEDRFARIMRYLDQGLIVGYDILGTVLIDGQLQQAEWIRDFIASHS